MTTRAVMSLTLSALLLGGATVGCATSEGRVASASARHDAAAARAALVQAANAGKALAKRRPAQAVRFAEAAVALRPQVAEYRVLLGQSYLKTGRFASARTAFTDALTLAPDNGKAALNLALAQTGLGDWAGARATLQAHGPSIPDADRGLALALAGDPAGAVELLTTAARSPDADVKTRQNLALALALSGRWQEARSLAAMDLSPADIDARMAQWAGFAHPAGAADQVAALLGVTPVVDAGQPVALALVAPAPVQAAEVKPAAETVAAADAPAPVPAPAPAPVVAQAAPPAVPVPPAPPEVQPRVLRPLKAYKVALASTPRGAPAKGDWFVQIGAFENAAVAHDGWARAIHRDAAFRGHVPTGMAFQAKAGQVYRLSIGGFTRADADAMCRSYRAKGGACFVRQGAGDQIASWAKKSVQLASR